MKYFAKYLPVEGEVKEGDMYLRIIPNTPELCTNRYVPYRGDKKVKLFLCNQDIQVGDSVQMDNSISPIIIDGAINIVEMLLEDSWFKVIGKVSPGAIWVKEGDKFVDEEIDYNDYDGYNIPIKIKCDKCNSFH